MDTLQESCRPVFGRNETFHPRWGWFSKAVSESTNNPYLFHLPNAPVLLGVGKNMVRAIRYWGEATTLLKEVRTPKERLAAVSPTRRGHALLNPETGADPYLELTGSLWLLHWWMIEPMPYSIAPLAWYAFNSFRPQEFSTHDLEQAFYEECLKGGGEWKPANNTLLRDSNCFLRTYVATDASKIDDALDAPFRQLGLLAHVPGQKRRFRFQTPALLEPEVMLYCCTDFLINIQHNASTATLARLIQEINSPGKILRTSEEQLLEALSNSRLSKWVGVSNTAGSTQIMFKESLDRIRLGAIQQLFDCTEDIAQAIAEEGQEAIYTPSTLRRHIQTLKHSRIQIESTKPKRINEDGQGDVLQRMELSAALNEAGIKRFS